MKTSQTKPRKKFLTVLSLVIGLGIAIFGITQTYFAIEERQNDKKWFYQRTFNDSLRLDYAYPDREYVRIYNQNSRRYVTPKMDWVSLGVSTGDSLTVFCDMDGKRGYINLNNGDIVIDGQYDYAWNFSEGLAAVCRDYKIGFVNSSGQEVIPCQYPTSKYAINRFGYAFHDGYCVITNSKNECGMINQQGQLVVDTIYDCIWAGNDLGVRIFQDEQMYGLMNLAGEIILPLYYENIWYDGVNLLATKEGVMVQLDASGKVINPFCSTEDYKPMFLPHDYNYESPTGYFRYHIGDKVGVIDPNGKMVIPAIYHEINQLNDHLFEAKTCDVDYYYQAWIVIDIRKHNSHPSSSPTKS
jgi:hypothetical protein